MYCDPKYLLSNVVETTCDEKHKPGRINYINFFASYEGEWFGYNFKKPEKRHITFHPYKTEVHYDFCFCYNKILCLSYVSGKLCKVRKKLKYDIYTPRQMKMRIKEKTVHKMVYYISG